MHYVHKISLMIHTASADSFLENQGIPSYFYALLKNLSRQTIKQFEFIYIDTFYEDNKHRFKTYLPGLPFIVKHVPLHHEHRYWFDKGHTYISAAKNTGIIYADGELVISCDDGEFFPDDFLERYWNHYLSGKFMLGMHHRMRSIEVKDGVPVFPITGDFYINDHRFNHMHGDVYPHYNGNWAFAGTSFKLEDALELNGYNERMDGCKSLEDCDFGNRLKMHGRQFVQDRQGIFYILDHQCYSTVPTTVADGQENTVPETEIKRKKIENIIAVENYGVLVCGEQLNEKVANKHPITQKHIEIIRRETLHYRQFDILAPEHRDKWHLWLGVPTFDLKKQREELRKSNAWRW